MANTAAQQTADGIYESLTDQQRTEVDRARQTIRDAEAELDELEARADHRRRRYGELQQYLQGQRATIDQRLASLRERFLDGGASLDDLIEHHREARTLADMEADMHKLGRASMREWERVVEAAQHRLGRPGRDIEQAQRVLQRHGVEA